MQIHDSENTDNPQSKNKNEKKENLKVQTRNEVNAKRSKYASVLCIDCKDLTKSQFCRECFLKYASAQMNHCRNKARQKKLMQCRGLSETVPTNVTSVDQQNLQIRDSENTDNPQSKNENEKKSTIDKSETKSVGKKKIKSVRKKKIVSVEKKNGTWVKKTFQNNYSILKKVLPNTPGRQEQLIRYALEDITKKKAKKSLCSDFDNAVNPESLGRVYKKQVAESPKGAGAYKIASGFSDELKGMNVNTIRTCLQVSYSKAKALSLGESISRKQNIRKFPEETEKLIIDFYNRDDISRVSNKQRDKLKSGTKRYLNFSVYTVYKIFQDTNPNVKVSESMFRLLMPDNFRFFSDIPLVACVCVYCENVRLMLFLLPGINNEYELFKLLICEKSDNQRFMNYLCICKLCSICCNWEQKIKSLIPSDTDYTKVHKFRTWKAIPEKNKAGKPVVRRSLQFDSGPVDKCLNHLIDTVLNPGKGFTFIEHFFRQTYQFQMYKDCLASLKLGECVFVQDFSRNKSLLNQDEPKAVYWSQGQVSIHPTVIYYKTNENEESKRVVITHLSDIHSHSAHLVFYITNDCINLLSNMFPEVQMRKVYLWSDGCASQYKGKHSFFYLDKFEVIIERNFFGSEHGKGESDAETGTISRLYLNAIRSNETIITNASDFCEYLVEKNEKKRQRR